MSSKKTLEGVVLRHRQYGEADVLVTFLTKEDGLFTGFARGLRLLKSRKAASLILFTKCRFQIHHGRGSLPSITEAQAIKSYACLQSDLHSFTVANLMAESILCLSKENEPLPHTYKALNACLKAMEERRDPLWVWSVFAIKLLSEQGLMTLSRECHGCQKLDANSDLYLVRKSAELVCAACASGNNLILSNRVLKLLCGIPHFSFKQIWQIDVKESDVAVLKEALQILLPYHLEKPLKSFEMFSVL